MLPTKAVLGIGSNVGDRQKNFETALHLLDLEEGIHVVKVSPYYLSEPIEYTDQEWFLNAIILIETTVMVEELFSFVKKIESKLGRNFNNLRFGPRILDLDILFYGDEIIHSSNVTVPHPRLHERRFVLAPLCDILPEKVHPILQKTMTALYEELSVEGQSIKKIC